MRPSLTDALKEFSDPPDAWVLIVGISGEILCGGQHQRPWTLHCAGKPLLALAVVAHANAGRLSLDRPVGDFIGTSGAGLAATSIDALLRHEAGLVEPHGLAMALIPQSRWLDVITRTAAQGRRSYSDVVGWLLLAHVLESSSLSSTFELIHEAVTIHARNFVCRGQAPGTLAPAGVVVPIDVSAGGGVPLLGEVEWADEYPNPATGFVGSISDLARLLHDLNISALGHGTIPSEVANLVLEGSEYDYDERLCRVSSYGRGVLADTSLHFDQGGTPLPGEWFAVASAGGGTLAASRKGADPVTLVMAWQAVALTDEEAAADRRRHLVCLLALMSESRAI